MYITPERTLRYYNKQKMSLNSVLSKTTECIAIGTG